MNDDEMNIETTSPPRRQRPPAAFTLIEVIVALTLGAVLMASVLYVFNLTRFTAVEAAVRTEMSRDAELALSMLRNDLRYAGAGVPSGECQDSGCTAGSMLTPSIRVAREDNLVMIGDVPYPNAEFPGIVTITRLAGDVTSTDVAITSTISGPCTPSATSASVAMKCQTTAFSPLVWDNEAADDCSQTATDARTCPWALNTWQRPGNNGRANLVATAVMGGWVSRRWDGTTAGVDSYWGVRLQAVSTGGNSDLTRDDYFGTIGSAHIAQLDRVFYALEKPDGSACAATDLAGDTADTLRCTLKRKQCWGEITNPGAATFPAATTSFVGSTATIANCTAPNDGTPWETLATNIDAFSLSYSQNGTTAISTPVATASLEDIRAVEIALTIKRDPPGGGQKLSHSVKERLFLDNRDRDDP